MKWLRWHLGTCEDAKFRMVARYASSTVGNVIGTWAALLEDAANLKHRGVAVQPSEYFAALLDIPPEEADMIIHSMVKVGLMTCDGGWRITNWEDRQFESDTTDPTHAERKRRWRERHRNDKGTKGNGRGTVAVRPDTDTDTDTEKRKRNPVAVPPEFEDFWKVKPERQGTNSKALALKAYLAAVNRGASPFQINGAARKWAAEKAGEKDRQFIKSASAWLNAGMYDDYTPDSAGPPEHLNGAERAAWVRAELEKDRERERSTSETGRVLEASHRFRGEE